MGAARRATLRWAWRLFRREWRQLVLVLALLTVSIAAAVGLSSAAYNLAPISGQAEFGTANHWLELRDQDPAVMQQQLDAAREYFGTIDAIGHRPVELPGTARTIDLRSQDPQGAFGRPMLALRDGRYPAADDEVALTDGIATELELAMGGTLDLDGTRRTVVGIVENPNDLHDEFALLDPVATVSAEYVTVLVNASSDRVEAFRPPGARQRAIAFRGDVPESVVAALAVLFLSTVALFLVALISAASFVVMAQRRQRQLGMLAAIGATPGNVRLVMIASGVLAGAAAGVLGTAIGVAGWLVAAPHLDEAVGYRIDTTNVPWWLVLAGIALSVIAATGAAWWPARSASRMPPVLALSGRPPRPRSARRSAAVALGFIAGGTIALAVAGDIVGNDTVNWTNALVICGGTLAVVVGVLLVSPLAVRVLARCAGRLPVAARLAWRDLGRFHVRAGAALAAISLVLGLPVAIVALTEVAADGASVGNLADTQLLVRPDGHDGPFTPTAGEVAGMQEGVDSIAAVLDDPTVVSLQVAHDPAFPTEPSNGQTPAISLASRYGDGWKDLSMLVVETPELLTVTGIDANAAAIESTPGVATTEDGDLALLGTVGDDGPRPDTTTPITTIQSSGPTYSAVPSAFITLDELTKHGWEAVPAGRWLIQLDHGLTAAELKAAREAAADAGLIIESRDHQNGLLALRSGATAAGVVLALTVVAMAVGLIRADAAGDSRTLTAAGATRRTRRSVTAATAGGLSILGVILGAAGAYVALIAGFGGLDELRPVPFTQLAIIVLGTPAIAALAGWLLGGREPPAIARAPIE